MSRASRVRNRVLIAGALLVTLSAQSYGPDDLDTAFGRDTLVISADRFACHLFDIWVAVSRPQQTRGLMFVRTLPERTGMLFVYAEPGPRSMWMKNTFIPLDMLFIRADGSVSTVVADTVPQSLRSIRSVEPVSYVLELNAGVTAALGIGVDSRIVWTSGTTR